MLQRLKKIFFDTKDQTIESTESEQIMAPLATGQVINIWPDAAPGSEHLSFEEEIIDRSPIEGIPDRAVSKVLNPTLTVYQPDVPNGISLLVAPGGGYSNIALDKEAGELSDWLNGLGITLFVLRYRLPGEGHKNRSDVATQDAQRAIRLIRYYGQHWGLDPNKVGILGFSAGGHVASSLAVKHDHVLYDRTNPGYQGATKQDQLIDQQSARPNFLLLGYPVISMNNAIVHKGSRMQLFGEASQGDNFTEAQINCYSNELLVTEDLPPTFIFHASDDQVVSVENAIQFYLAAKEKSVPVELHLFDKGGHGFSNSSIAGLTVENWPYLVARWIDCVVAS